MRSYTHERHAGMHARTHARTRMPPYCVRWARARDHTPCNIQMNTTHDRQSRCRKRRIRGFTGVSPRAGLTVFPRRSSRARFTQNGRNVIGNLISIARHPQLISDEIAQIRGETVKARSISTWVARAPNDPPAACVNDCSEPHTCR